VEPMLEDRLEDQPAEPRPQPASHRQRKARLGPLPFSSRVTMSIGGTLALLAAGIAVGTGAVKTPLSDTAAAGTPKASTLASSPAASQPTASPINYAVASMPPTAASHKPKAKPKPSHSPGASASAPAAGGPASAPGSAPAAPPAESGGLTPQPTAEYETPKGNNQKAWSEAILNALGAPLTSANIISLGYWMQNEAGYPPYGIVGANNPINVSEPCCGGVPIKDDGDGVTFLQSYPSAAQGVEAIAAYLERGNYVNIVADLKAGVGLNDPNLADEIGLYSGGGYTTIPDSYGASQGTPEG